MSDPMRIERHGAVLEIRFNRPEKKNAITQAMYLMATEALVAAEDDDSLRAIMFSGEGESFSSGNDIMDFAMIAQQAMAGGAGLDESLPVWQFLKALAHAQKPLVAAVKGQAVGIGTTLLLHCDLVVVAEDAKLTTPFGNLALTPEAAASLLLPATVGYQKAFAMIALGEAMSGLEAVQAGLANRAVAADQVDPVALDLAQKLALRAPGALRAAKGLMRDGSHLWAIMQREGHVFHKQLGSSEAKEAFSAFIERRTPDFSKA